jgi:hypothetical protein
MKEISPKNEKRKRFKTDNSIISMAATVELPPPIPLDIHAPLETPLGLIDATSVQNMDSADPLDSSGFDPIQYINIIFPNGQLLQ